MAEKFSFALNTLLCDVVSVLVTYKDNSLYEFEDVIAIQIEVLSELANRICFAVHSKEKIDKKYLKKRTLPILIGLLRSFGRFYIQDLSTPDRPTSLFCRLFPKPDLPLNAIGKLLDLIFFKKLHTHDIFEDKILKISSI